ncbi:MAG: Calx-beta domain-containing protein [bacterium]
MKNPDGCRKPHRRFLPALFILMAAFFSLLTQAKAQGVGTPALVSIDNTGGTDFRTSFNSAVSADGRYVVFISDATGLDTNPAVIINNDPTDMVNPAPQDFNNVFIRDLKTGVTRLVSISADNIHSGNASCFNPVIGVGALGPVVAFESDASNLVGTDTNNERDVFARQFSADLSVGATVLVSIGTDGDSGKRTDVMPATGEPSLAPSISADGTLVAFQSDANDLVNSGTADANPWTDVFVRNLVANTTELVSINKMNNGGGDSDSTSPAISGDGSAIAFASQATNLDPANVDTNSSKDIYLYSVSGGTLKLLSPNKAGDNGGNAGSINPVINNNGTVVAYQSIASDLVSVAPPDPSAIDNNGTQDIYLRDVSGNTTYLISVNTSGKSGSDGMGGGENSIEPKLNSSGDTVIFKSAAQDLTSNPIDNTSGTHTNIFYRKWQSSLTGLVSVKKGVSPLTDSSGDADSSNASISGDGRFVAFDSASDNLVDSAVDTNGVVTDVFLRDIQANTTTLLVSATGGVSANGSSTSPKINDNGSIIVFDSLASDLDAADTNGSNNKDVYYTSQAGKFDFSANAYSVNESDGNVTVTINRSNGTVGSVDLTIALTDGTATKGSDYNDPASLTVSFTSGLDHKDVVIPVVLDMSPETDETFTVKITAATGGGVVGNTNNPTTVTIHNTSVCGDTVCDAGEDNSNCPADCPAVCGNSTCETGENNTNCPADCAAVCGNAVCETGETNATCPGDCPPVCGNAICEIGETNASCPADCPVVVVCGNAICEVGENVASCPADCAANTCGNHTCESGENPTNCASDCQANVCGNNACDSGENPTNCAADCQANVCGNNVCDAGENNANCAADCPPVNNCGNNVCDPGENNANCPADCPNPVACNNNGTCDAGENNANCPADCPVLNVCNNNGVCESGESNANCPADCPNPVACNNNGVCEAGEDASNCPSDCSAQSACNNNGVCEPGETSVTCPIDCAGVSACNNDGICEVGESAATCPSDCQSPGNLCGNGTCDAGETVFSCPIDCFNSSKPQPRPVPPPFPINPKVDTAAGGCSLNPASSSTFSGTAFLPFASLLLVRFRKRRSR